MKTRLITGNKVKYSTKSEIEKKLEAMRTKLDKESQARRVLENTIGTLNGTLAFKTKLFETEISSMKNSHRVEIAHTKEKDAKDFQAIKSNLEKSYKINMSRSLFYLFFASRVI